MIVQRSLVSLARALVHEAKILILDEATGMILLCSYDDHAKAQVPYSIRRLRDRQKDTRYDRNRVQGAHNFVHRSYVSHGSILSAFADHYADRLRTIISYDRICVLDAGIIAVCIPFFCLH
jgi:ABC-type multidrug transport system fused ATPase/permease subunit